MSIRRRQSAHVSHERWLVSYADFVTLLFAFFVVLYASAQVDRQRALQLSDAIRSGFQQLGVFQGDRADQQGVRPVAWSGGDTQAVDLAALKNLSSHPGPGGNSTEDFAGIRSELERALAAQIQRNEVVLHMEPDGLVVTLREIGFFDSGSATIKPGAEGAFARVAGILRAHACALRIEGHTDNVPIHTAQFASNWELSTARATELVKSLVDNYGISPALLSAAGYAEFHPASANTTTQGRALNRRVDLVILKAQPARPLTLPTPTSGRTSEIPAPPREAAGNSATIQPISPDPPPDHALPAR